MRDGARVIIIRNNKILLMHRIKNKEEYYVLPGGGIEKDETPKEAAIREVKEETNLDLEIEPLWKFRGEYNSNYGYYFLVKNFKGKVRLGRLELERQSENNKYFLRWVLLKDIGQLNLYPKELKEKILITFVST